MGVSALGSVQMNATVASPPSDRQVSLSWSNTVVEPGDEVVLRVTAQEPASLVGVLAVDKATMWGGPHNDLTEDSVSG